MNRQIVRGGCNWECLFLGVHSRLINSNTNKQTNNIHSNTNTYRCTRKRVAPVGGGVVAGAEDIAFVLAEHGANGHSAAQSLGAREHVRLDAWQGKRET